SRLSARRAAGRGDGGRGRGGVSGGVDDGVGGLGGCGGGTLSPAWWRSARRSWCFVALAVGGKGNEGLGGLGAGGHPERSRSAQIDADHAQPTRAGTPPNDAR